MFHFFKRPKEDRHHVPYTRLASWVIGSSTVAGNMICNLLAKEHITPKEELQDNWLLLCTEIASFHAASIVQIIMENANFERKDFAVIYKDMEKAFFEVARTHEFVSNIGQLARYLIDYKWGDQNRAYILHYFEEDQVKLGISDEHIAQYAEDYGDASIGSLDPRQLCILIRANRSTLIEKNSSAERRSFGMEVVFNGVLRNERFGFVALASAVIKLLKSGADDKPIAELNSEKLILDDMGGFLKT
jgi:hypothetical protein